MAYGKQTALAPAPAPGAYPRTITFGGPKRAAKKVGKIKLAGKKALR